MNNQYRFAAIDIGSNAVRLLLSCVFEHRDGALFKKMALMRMPIRLGQDAFSRQRISGPKIEQLATTMQGFKALIEAFGPIDYLACATSAMREAANSSAICDLILKQTGIRINIIDGLCEAQVIFTNRSQDFFNAKNAYLYIDVGGGSTEITLFSQYRKIASRSFDIGTIRIMQNLVSKSHWKEMKRWIKQHNGLHNRLVAIGSGGNINKINRLANVKNSRPLTYAKMRRVKKNLKMFSVDERITRLKLRPDRADVIVPASKIYLSAMKWAGIEKIYVPQIGLADGLVRLMFDRYKSGQNGRAQELGDLIYTRTNFN
jgi:exopolyphosphatase/guanosine-5'-triphosphate,3'-diphosphate pyrophosphatase